MPSFYPNNLPRQLPPTPPDYYTFDHSTSTRGTQSSAIVSYGIGGVDPFGGKDGSEHPGYHKQCGEQAVGPYARSAYRTETDARPTQSFIPPFAHRENAYGHVGAPVLPPIRIPERANIEQTLYQNTQSQHPAAQAQPKEEKVAGGVAAHLDYDMEQMVDFVSEMAQGMYDLFQSHICLADIDIVRSVQPNATVAADFRKYVSQILTSTRLPSSTILLGLHYLATRMTMLAEHGIYSSSTGHLYHMLTTALMLGSKFLDDNTFQNRSWAEVSHIQVSELNSLEMEWLLDIKWNLHFDMKDPQGFSAWLKEWDRWQTRRIEITLASLKLTPLDSNLRRQHSINKQLPPTPIYPSYAETAFALLPKDRTHSIWQTPTNDPWPPLRSMSERSPPSAPESGPNTPDWYGRLGNTGYGQAPLRSTRGMTAAPLQIFPPLQSSYAYTPYPQLYTPSPWSGHSMGCMCGYCSTPHGAYSMAHTYGAQPVAG
ncbi:hypothetical protein MMC19_007705 [Ptychographa xylographoides]|nr:hypothetical protein [Ptychographa xylographoides]